MESGMEISKNCTGRIPLPELFYYLFFAALFFAKGIGLYDGQEVFKAFLVLGTAGLALKLLLTEYTIKELAIIGILCVAAGFSYLHTREKGILFTVMVMIGLKNIPVKRLCRVALAVWSLSYIPAVVLTTLGLMDSPFRVHMRPAVGFIIRWGMGSAHPNVGHIGYLVLVMLIVYLLGERISWKWILLLLAGNGFVYLYTVSQTGMLMTGFYLAANVYLMYRKKPSRVEYGLVECVLPACMLASLALPLVLQGRAFDIVNKLMNTRLLQSKLYLTEEKITLLGSGMQRTDAITTMDNSFVFAFMTYGILTFGLLMLAYFLLVRHCVKEKKHGELAIIVTLLMTGLSEPLLFNTSFKNISLIFMGAVLFAGKEAEGSFLAKKVAVWRLPALIGLGKKEEADIPALPLPKWMEGSAMEIRGCGRKWAAALAAGAALGAVLWGAIYGYTADIPYRLAVPRELCDAVELPSVYFGPGEVPEDGLVLGYVDAQTEMVVFEDALPRYEYLRGTVCRTVYGGILGFVVVFLRYYMIKYKDSRRPAQARD